MSGEFKNSGKKHSRGKTDYKSIKDDFLIHKFVLGRAPEQKQEQQKTKKQEESNTRNRDFSDCQNFGNHRCDIHYINISGKCRLLKGIKYGKLKFVAKLCLVLK